MRVPQQTMGMELSGFEGSKVFRSNFKITNNLVLGVLDLVKVHQGFQRIGWAF